MNSVILVGRPTADPTTRQAGDHAVVRFRLAVENRAEQAPTYVDVDSWGGHCDAVARYLTQGRLVAVAGRLSQSEWADDDGRRHERHYVTAASVDFLDRPDGRGARTAPAGA